MSLKAQPIPAPSPTPNTVSVRIRTTERRQEIQGFGASDCWSINPIGEQWSQENKERLAQLLFCREQGIGLSLWRFNIGAGSDQGDVSFARHPWRVSPCFKASADAAYDWNKQAGQQWFLRAAHRYGVERCTAFTNSPPVWLTRNGCAYGEDDRDITTNLRSNAEADFARFLADVLTHFAEEGIPFMDVSPINEPNWDWTRAGGQEGCRFANEDIRRVVRALSAELKSRGLSTHIDACDSGDIRLLLDDDLYRQYAGLTDPEQHCTIGNEGKGFRGKYREIIADLFGDAEIRAILQERISGHSYWTTDNDHDRTTLRHYLRETLRRHLPERAAEFWMTEFCVMESGRDLGMDTALRVATVIHHDLTITEASAWQWWLAVSPHDYKDGLIYTDFDADGGPETILPSKTFWALGQYSRFLRPGSYRVETDSSGGTSDLLISAYRTASESIALVVINPSSKAQSLTLSADIPLASWSTYLTDDTRDLTDGDIGNGNDFLVPARSIVTLLNAPTE